MRSEKEGGVGFEEIVREGIVSWICSFVRNCLIPNTDSVYFAEFDGLM